jgi:hypothetical protein
LRPLSKEPLNNSRSVAHSMHTYPLSSGAIRWYAGSTKELSHA